MLERPIPSSRSRTRPGDSQLKRIFLEFAETDPQDLRRLLVGLGKALQLASTTVPATGPKGRQIWNAHQREAYRSRAAWERWLLRQKFPDARDAE